jgi:hypothetical protein
VTSSQDEGPDRPQVWHQYRMSHSINVAWLGERVSVEQMHALEDAWDHLVVHEEWRAWKRAHLVPASPFLYLAVRDGIDKRRLLTTRTGVSMHVPTAELTEAQAGGRLQEVFLGILRDIYSRWARSSEGPPPPELPPSV